ncbi:MAG: hypothetical protein FJX35_15650 [Alphaproteobacteria bacterium]|nr:hypothetical protein [Alphaproteobacteria bacterium]
MQCPVDKIDLVMTDRQGIEIDYCPKCRGVWLDRGELDKLIERSVPTATPPAATPPTPTQHGPHSAPVQTYRKKKESFLSELFDF